jgi:hypothetical protein
MDAFKNDESGYLAWHAANPNGFVLNHFGGTNPAFNVLHRAKCVFLWRSCDDGARTVVEKWCAGSESELSRQADLILGVGNWKRCGVCFRSFREDTRTNLLAEPFEAPTIPQESHVWVAGEPAVCVGAGEKEWKDLLVTRLGQNVPREKPQWIDVEFRMTQQWLYRRDIDNLLTPVLESARDAGWVDRGFANLGSVTARKIAVLDGGQVGAQITPYHESPILNFERMGILVEAPVMGLDDDAVKWTLYETSFALFKSRPELRYPPQYPMSMEIRITINNASRRKSLQALVKPCIDGTEPIMGHPYNLLPEARENLKRRLAPQDEMIVSLWFHVRGGELDTVAVLLRPAKAPAELVQSGDP